MPKDRPLLAVRAAEWISGVDSLFARRPDLVGVHAFADVTLDSIRSSA